MVERIRAALVLAGGKVERGKSPGFTAGKFLIAAGLDESVDRNRWHTRPFCKPV